MKMRRLFILGVLIATTGLGGCGGGDDGVPDGAPPEASDFKDEWPTPNGDLANRRVASSEIDSGNVDELGVAWTIPIKGGGTFGNYASTPIVADGVVYTQDLTSNVKAIDLETGDIKWSKDYNSPTVGPNGVTIGYDKIYGATSDFAFALDKETGDEVWRSQKLTRNANEGIDMAPAVFDDTLYVSTVPGNTKSFYKGNGAGVLWALDADTGKERWKFWTVPEDLWSAEHKEINSGGGLWHPPAFDDSGDVYIDVANPAPWPGTNDLPWGSSRPGPNPHTNTLVKLNPDDGTIIWEQQVLAHDVYDWDLQLPPVLVDDGDRNLALAAGKVGYVYAMDTKSGERRVEARGWQAQRARQGQRARARGRLRPDAEAPAHDSPGHPRRSGDPAGLRGRRRVRADREHPHGLQRRRRSSTSRSPRARARWSR